MPSAYAAKLDTIECLLREIKRDQVTRVEYLELKEKVEKHEEFIDGNGKPGLKVWQSKVDNELAKLIQVVTESARTVKELSESVRVHHEDRSKHNAIEQILGKATKQNITILALGVFAAHELLEITHINIVAAVLKWFGINV